MIFEAFLRVKNSGASQKLHDDDVDDRSCYLSARILGVNPFDQPGVEAYKINMFKTLGK